ncbi:hypothetical protein CPC08DRAFT_757700 [Agrocybe pediades]|nr:hypothetical protein CPC08DRAFT_757700 [Agrocybe pediades]
MLIHIHVLDENAESVLVTVAKKELDYLEKFGTPRAVHKHFRREYYNCEKQLPSDHATNLMHYLHLTPFLVPRDDSLNAFCIRHPDLTENNIIVTSTSSDGGGLQIVSLLDWQHAAVLPLFLNTILPKLVEIEADDEVARTMVKPTLPEGFEELTKVDQEQERELLRRRLVHYQYTVCTGSYNWVPKEVMSPLYDIRLRLYAYARAPWKGETIDLLCALMDFVRHWDSEHLARMTAQTGGDSASNINDSKSDHPSCPVTSTQEEMDSAELLYKALRRADQVEKLIRQITGCGPLPKAWVPPARYEQAKALGQNFKRLTLEAAGEDVRDAIDANWPLDDFDEEEYL